MGQLNCFATSGGRPFDSNEFSFAYVDFGSAEAKIAAIARSEQPLLGRRLLIKDGAF